MGTYASPERHDRQRCAESYAAADVRAKAGSARVRPAGGERTTDRAARRPGVGPRRSGQAVPLASVARFRLLRAEGGRRGRRDRTRMTATRTTTTRRGNCAQRHLRGRPRGRPSSGTIRMSGSSPSRTAASCSTRRSRRRGRSRGDAQALGLVAGEAAYADDGNFLAGSLMDYLYPAAADVPEITMEHIETPSAVTERGQGSVRPARLSAPAAVVNTRSPMRWPRSG
ncbi:hypothetical protein HBB16_19740 [Pseudonocardia sp. MCCB 268]|nr:hypothetical protein [Pseudonocardia cytotoxica]